NTPYSLKEAALLFESGSYRNLDAVISVYAPQSLRLQRVMQRDQVEAAAVQSRMNKQMPDFEKLQLADFIITNNGKQALISQVLAVHEQLLKQ
ncbi:MAG: dephospho-CoA kinase, partial [Bacteroidota bacterium]